ncbi:MAG TPA: trypsin-like peptidase domain-containing protein, partial [Rhodocyclaceae bacterium]|nr:trypsin-like peptidase domain-containing protein [Rhodocyclaceae bacterium]
MQRLWLIFAQTVTVAVALLFVVSTLKPEWLPRHAATVTVHEAASGGSDTSARNAASYHDAARKALPAVVHIYTTQEIKAPRHPLFNDPIFRHFFGDRLDNGPQRSAGLGSGVIVSSDGYILTNFHVIDGADSIEVAINDGRRLKAKVVGSDPESDLAVLQIKADKLPAITFGQIDNLRVGDVVLAIGNPFGVGQTVTMGIVSALDRS